MNKSPGTLVVNTYNIFPWCRLDYLGLRRQCVCPLLWQIDPNYGILWQPVCHFCVGSVPIAVLVWNIEVEIPKKICCCSGHPSFSLAFPVLVCSIFNRVLFGCYPRMAVHNILYLCIFDIVLLQISTSAVSPWPVWSYVSVQRSTVLPKRAGLRSSGVRNIDHRVIWLRLPLLFSWHHLTRLLPSMQCFRSVTKMH